MHQEKEIERQDAIRLHVQQHSQHADLHYEELQGQQLIRIQRTGQEELEKREDELANQAHRAANHHQAQSLYTAILYATWM
ncbi:hypothetical protein SERLA73DRAFT_70120 [Serpula lacrymans var. lacrymans S7.3]|uniref:Uncharacterized protein n=1 Tax=Serpula lacrymans var. lacrymans (strain S7.3) TaxID=936435 RepID=F8PLY8_SERL3|nr:hypothetical protein SERLA73DRAFT_70120 [Serpula lacrymans var. lacrymans S7.3]